MRRTIIRGVLAVAMGTGLVGAGGCASKTGTGAIVGGLGGAAIGAAIGSANGNAGKGALVGGAVGALGGAVVGNTMDHADKKKEQARQDQQRREEEQRRDEDRRRGYARDERGRDYDEDRRPTSSRRDDDRDADRDSDRDEGRAAVTRRGEETETAPAPAKDAPVTVNNVIAWWNDGETEEDIIDRINHSKTPVSLTSKDESRLRDEGVSDEVIDKLKRTNRQAAVEQGEE
jgi:hypothetical protein